MRRFFATCSVLALLSAAMPAVAEDAIAERHMKVLNEVLYEGIPSGPYAVYVEDLKPVDVKLFPAVLFFKPRMGLLSDIAQHTVQAFVKRVHVFDAQPTITIVGYVPNEEQHDALYRALVNQRVANVKDYLVNVQNISPDLIKTDVRPASVVPCTLAPRECGALLHRVEIFASAQ